MGRYYFDEVETDEGDQILERGHGLIAKNQVDQPRRSPIRRKDKLRQGEGLKPKAKRNHKKIQNRLKYDWQGE
jgi:hypothetical protein